MKSEIVVIRLALAMRTIRSSTTAQSAAMSVGPR